MRYNTAYRLAAFRSANICFAAGLADNAAARSAGTDACCLSRIRRGPAAIGLGLVDLGKPGRPHPALCDQSLGDAEIALRPLTRAAPGSEPLRERRGVATSLLTIDPSLAERFFEGLGIGQAGRVRHALLGEDQPNALGTIVIRVEPSPERCRLRNDQRRNIQSCHAPPRLPRRHHRRRHSGPHSVTTRRGGPYPSHRWSLHNPGRTDGHAVRSPAEQRRLSRQTGPRRTRSERPLGRRAVRCRA